MIGCLLIDIKTWNKSNYKLNIVKPEPKVIELSIASEYSECLCLHLKLKDKTQLWQLALNLESHDIITGYGSGSSLQEAKLEAVKTLEKRAGSQSHRTATV